MTDEETDLNELRDSKRGNHDTHKPWLTLFGNRHNLLDHQSKADSGVSASSHTR